MIKSIFVSSETQLDREKDMRRSPLRYRRLWTQFQFITRTHVWLFLVTCFFIFLFSTVLLILFLTDGSRPISHSRLVRPQLKRKLVETPPASLTREKSKIDENLVYHDFNYLSPPTLTYETRKYSNDVEILFRLPNRTSITALLLIFHGCSRSANDWFHIVERQRIIGGAVDLGFGCLAFQSTDQFSQCWSSETDIYDNQDFAMVANGLKSFYQEFPQLEKLPIFTFGASSGGIFSSIFVSNPKYKVHGQILFISIIAPEILDLHVKKKTYPPTSWIYMPRDKEFASEARINAAVKLFISQDIPSKTFQIGPIPLTPTTFHERIPTITRDTSQYIFYRFQQNKWLDDEHLLKYNPRRFTTWKSILFPTTNNSTESTITMNNLKQHETIISDFLNTIYGEHEISYEHSYEALQWLWNTYQNRKDPN